MKECNNKVVSFGLGQQPEIHQLIWWMENNDFLWLLSGKQLVIWLLFTFYLLIYFWFGWDLLQGYNFILTLCVTLCLAAGSGPQQQQQLSAWQDGTRPATSRDRSHSLYMYICVDMVPVLQVIQQMMQKKHKLNLVLLDKDAIQWKWTTATWCTIDVTVYNSLSELLSALGCRSDGNRWGSLCLYYDVVPVV